MGVITDMSGLNDAFNSTICSLKVKAKFGFEESNEQQEKDFNFVIKSPPKMNFIRMVHKLSRPFFNEVSWYGLIVHDSVLQINTTLYVQYVLGHNHLTGALPS